MKHIHTFDSFLNEAKVETQEAVKSLIDSSEENDELQDELEIVDLPNGTVNFSGNAFVGKFNGFWQKTGNMEMKIEVTHPNFINLFDDKTQEVTLRQKVKAKDLGYEMILALQIINDIDNYAENFNGFEKVEDFKKFLKTYSFEMNLKDFVEVEK